MRAVTTKKRTRTDRAATNSAVNARKESVDADAAVRKRVNNLSRQQRVSIVPRLNQ